MPSTDVVSDPASVPQAMMKFASSQSQSRSKKSSSVSFISISPPPPASGQAMGQSPWNPLCGEFSNCSHSLLFGLKVPKQPHSSPCFLKVYTCLQPRRNLHACVQDPP